MSAEDLTPRRVSLAAVSPSEAEDLRDAPASGLSFPDLPRLALDQRLEQLRDRAGDVLATQGRLRGLLRANAVLASDLSLPSLLESLVGEACRLVQARYAAIVVMGANDRMDELIAVGLPAALRAKVQGHPSWREVSALLAPEMTEGEEPSETSYGSASIGGPPPSGFFELPVRLGTKVYGRLYLRKFDGGVFTDEDEEVVTALAATAAVALANASLFEESEQRHRWLEAGTGLANDLLSSETIHPLAMICQYAMRAARADFATVNLPDQTYAAGVAVASDLLADEKLSHFKEMRRDADLTSRTGQGMLINNYGDDDDPRTETDVRVGSVMVVPLAAGDHAEGALTLGRVAGGTEFSTADLAMAGGFATQATVALAFNATRRTELHVARLEDRDRIAMDLHDHVIQEIFAVGMGLEKLTAVLDDSDQSAQVKGFIDSLNNTISTIRTRIFQLQPSRHDPGGLQTQILELADRLAEQLGYAPQLHFAGSMDAADPELTDDILAVTREALSNCARHAHATAVTVLVTNRDSMVTLTVTDNGVGLGNSSRSSGLTYMRRRAERHHGTLTVTTPEAGGTRVTWTAHL